MIKTILSIFFLFSLFGINAQNTKTTKTTYFYSVSNVISSEQLDKVKTEFSVLKNVSEVKTNYKPEKAMGQFIVIVIEKIRTSEGEDFFEVTDLKKIILKNNLNPLDFNFETETIQP